MSSAANDAASQNNWSFKRGFVTILFMGSTLIPVNSSHIATALVPIAEAMNGPV